MKVLVLGGYGLIGAACIRALLGRGIEVTGFGRSQEEASRSALGIDWIIGDLGRFEAAAWAHNLDGFNVVVNAAEALQDGLMDDVTAIHETMIQRLVEAKPSHALHVIQISAAGAPDDATKEFMRSKARGHTFLMSSQLRWTVLRPTLAIGAIACGGTALIGAVSGLPVIGPSLPFAASVQTIALDELLEAVADCAQGAVADGAIFELTEGSGRSLNDNIAAFRDWLGFTPFRFRILAPNWVLAMIAKAADAFGWLGWCSPLRTTSLKTLEDGVIGDPSAWQTANGRAFRP